MIGTVDRVNVPRGFGFIASPGEPDAFFHFRQLVGLDFGEQLIGRRVEFAVEKTDKGLRALSVRPIEEN